MSDTHERGVEFEESDFDSDFTKKVIVQKSTEENVGFMIKALIRAGLANNRKQAEFILIWASLIFFFIGMLFLKFS